MLKLTSAMVGMLKGVEVVRVTLYTTVLSLFANIGLNYVLIFGHLGLPALGVQGAAIATVISRYVEMLIVVIYAHRHTVKYPFFRGVYRQAYIPGRLILPGELSPVKYHGIVRIWPVVSRRVLSSHCHSFSFRR